MMLLNLPLTIQREADSVSEIKSSQGCQWLSNLIKPGEKAIFNGSNTSYSGRFDLDFKEYLL
jgi:hypothetical protein